MGRTGHKIENPLYFLTSLEHIHLLQVLMKLKDIRVVASMKFPFCEVENYSPVSAQ